MGTPDGGAQIAEVRAIIGEAGGNGLSGSACVNHGMIVKTALPVVKLNEGIAREYKTHDCQFSRVWR